VVEHSFLFGALRSTKSAGVSKDHDDRQFTFNGDLSDVSAKSKSIPDLPIIIVAEDTKTIRVLPHSAAAPTPQISLAKDDWTRWNDYGIGLFLQGDLSGAEQAFTKSPKSLPKISTAGPTSAASASRKATPKAQKPSSLKLSR